MKKNFIYLTTCLALLLVILAVSPALAARAQSSLPPAPWPPRPLPVADPLPQVAPQQTSQSGCPNWAGTITLDPGFFIRIAFMSYRDIKWEIYLVDGCSNSTAVRLTNNSAFDGYPRIDPAQSRIVFVSDRDGSDELYSMDLDGGSLTRLTTDPGVDTYPSWSPNGQQIVFVSDRDGDPDLYLMQRDGSAPHLLIHLDGLDTQPAWSPDGKSIAWIHWTSSTAGQIYTLVLGETPLALTEALSNPSGLAWAPDSTRLAFSADINGDGWSDLAWQTVGTHSLAWHSCMMSREPPCDVQISGFWPEDGTPFGTRLTYVYNGSTRVIKTAELASFNFIGTGVWQRSYNSLDYAPDAVSTDSTPPTSRVLPLPPYSPAAGFDVQVAAADQGAAGLSSIMSQISTDSPTAWTSWRSLNVDNAPSSATLTLGSYSGQPGSTVYFKSQAVDVANHIETSKTLPEASTRLYAWQAAGKVTDVREGGLEGASALVSPAALNTPLSTSDGSLAAYLPADGAYTASVSRAGYATLPPQTLKSQLGVDLPFNVVLPGVKDWVKNGQFEDPAGALTDWQTAGTLTLGAQRGYSGVGGAGVVSACPSGVCLLPEETVHYLAGSFISTMTPNGTLHVIAQLYDKKVAYIYRTAGGQWSSPETLSDLDIEYTSRLTAADDGSLAFNAYFNGTRLLLYRSAGGPWQVLSLPVVPYIQAQAFDSQGRLHILMTDTVGRVVYLVRDTTGTIAQPRIVDADCAADSLNLESDTTGGIHLAFLCKNEYQFKYVQVSPAGEFSPVEKIALSNTGAYTMRVFPAPDGSVKVLVLGLAYFTRDSSGVWTQIQVPIPSVQYHSIGFMDAVVDTAGNLHVLYNDTSYPDYTTHMYWIVQLAGQSHAESRLVRDVSTRRAAKLSVGLNGRVDLFEVDYIDYNDVLLYVPYQVAPAQSEGSLSQTLTLPSNLYKPTLSYFYRIDQFVPAGQTHLEVTLTPQGGDPVTLASLTGLYQWSHAWTDLSPWKGQTVTLSFRLVQAAGESQASLSIDEVSVSEWTTVRVTSLEVGQPNPILDWHSQPVSVRLLGENFAEGVKVVLGGSEITPTRLSETELTFILPANTPPGRYRPAVFNPGGGPFAAPAEIWLGISTYLPNVIR